MSHFTSLCTELHFANATTPEQCWATTVPGSILCLYTDRFKEQLYVVLCAVWFLELLQLCCFYPRTSATTFLESSESSNISISPCSDVLSPQLSRSLILSPIGYRNIEFPNLIHTTTKYVLYFFGSRKPYYLFIYLDNILLDIYYLNFSNRCCRLWV